MFLNLILRVLPFYLREPIVIGICLTMAGACFYWFVQVGGLGRGGFGLLFLAIAVLRAYFFRKEWRAHQAAKVLGFRPEAM
ncbi:hypothetical protein ACIGMX_16600 [Streptomyces aquilus]|uniref:Uncharacterized protein n=1 Tax=Streptomyces aquilus TaxID=2548456 RepID=A0A3Q9BYK5_9ACTN|nr:hypothetical protein [Streptomyces aquilus]AZP17402.1 hypothetical protein EJC51_15520 [Streptomyces aquilus]